MTFPVSSTARSAQAAPPAPSSSKTVTASSAPAVEKRAPGDEVDAFQRAQGVAAPVTTAATPTQVATRFYEAFEKRDAGAMRDCYAPNATFKDPIYTLNGRDETMGMWNGVFQKGKNATVTHSVLSTEGDTVRVAWKADYELLGRKVHNESITTMQVKDGKIVQQQDEWSWSRWARQAFPLGPLVDFPPVKAGLLMLIRNS